MSTKDLIAEMTENVNKYGGENMTTYLMVQAIQRLTAVDKEMAALRSENADLRAQVEALTVDNKELRRHLCAARAGYLAYMDDGEAQDNSVHPCIDYLRDSLKDINAKLLERMQNNTPSPLTRPASFPERDTTKPAEQQGLFRKFVVNRVDGSDAPGGKHHGCEYFVLDLDHDKAAPAALVAYAEAVAETHPQLAADLRARFGEALTRPAVPEGWMLVPIEPTEEMSKAGGEYAECGIPANAVFGYRAMLAAAPQPPVDIVELTVIDPTAWEPCSPGWLMRGGNCADAPRLWHAATGNHWHPKIAAAPQPEAVQLHQLVPIEPSPALLRPFHSCPPDELPEAWQAMIEVAKVSARRSAEAAQKGGA